MVKRTWKGKAIFKEDSAEFNSLFTLLRITKNDSEESVVCWDFNRDRVFAGKITKSKDGILVKTTNYDLYIIPADEDYVFDNYEAYFGHKVETKEEMWNELDKATPPPLEGVEYE